MFPRRERPTRPTRRRSRFLAALAAVPLSLGALGLTFASPASAASMSAHFRVISWSNSKVCTDAFALIPLSEYDTWGYLNNGAHARIELWGDDPAWDNRLFTSRWAYLNAPVDNVRISGYQKGIGVSWYGCYDRAFFDEDIGDDEVYVRLTVIDGDGHLLATGTTNVLTIPATIY
jgi:hypothetical protein